MAQTRLLSDNSVDRTNIVIAVAIWLFSFIIYAMTVQPTFSFWDCGEFIACSYILGIPHPPGTPLFILIGRVISIIPFVEDISHRINYISVISSAFTAMFSYLLTVRMVGYFFGDKKDEKINRLTAYIGGIVGSLFVAFGRTNWANSVEAEVYGLALMLSVMIIWLTMRYFEQRGTPAAAKTLVLIFYLAMLGVGIHMTVFLVVPIASLFFILHRDAEPRDYALLSGFIIAELAMIILFSNGRGGSVMFMLGSAVLGLTMLAMLYKKINWALTIAIVSLSTIMISFSLYMKSMPFFLIGLLIIGYMSEKNGWRFKWKTAVAVILVGLIGMSVHAFIPIRSAHNPRIDENDPSRNWNSFVRFLDRKQYGQQSMVDRMFNRRGTWSNQLGRHAHMGFWSYFEEQYSTSGWGFLPFFLLGLLGLYVAIKKRQEVGLPFLALLLVASVGLVLYMNFADGTQYDPRTGDAYMEVRNRDYFFTPAFVFFGIAMGMGVSGLITLVREALAKSNPSMQKSIVYASMVLILLPGFSLAHNYHACDRSNNYIPYNYAANLLDSCEPNSILFTSGDNDTFPLWCIQEVYEYRKDIRVVNLSLLNTDWYVYQMKNFYDVPMSLTDDQILWNDTTIGDQEMQIPSRPFRDRPRERTTYLIPMPYEGRIVKVQDMMVDEIVLENKWRNPVYFSSAPYAESPLKLRDRAPAVGMVYRLDRNPPERLIDEDTGYDLYMNTYRFKGYESSEVYRDENATGVYVGYGINAVRIWDEMLREGDTTRALDIADLLIEKYPEYWQMPFLKANYLKMQGDTAAADAMMWELHDTLDAFSESNPENLFYRIDLGLTKVELGNQTGEDQLIEDGLEIMWDAFEDQPQSNHMFRKLATVLGNQRRYSDIQRAAEMHAEYKRNLGDPLLQQFLRRNQQPPPPMQGNPLTPPGG